MKIKAILFLATVCLSLSAHANEYLVYLDFLRKSCTDNMTGIFALNPPGLGVNLSEVKIEPIRAKQGDTPQYAGFCMLTGQMILDDKKQVMRYVGAVRPTGTVDWSVLD